MTIGTRQVDPQRAEPAEGPATALPWLFTLFLLLFSPLFFDLSVWLRRVLGS
jgi:hypothetical protein